MCVATLSPALSHDGEGFSRASCLASSRLPPPPSPTAILRACRASPPYQSSELMTEALVLLATSFWYGALHAIQPGHGKTIAAAYIVGARGRPVDAWILGIFVTLSHTSGIVLVGVLASLGLPGLMPQRVEIWMKIITGLLVIRDRRLGAVDPAGIVRSRRLGSASGDSRRTRAHCNTRQWPRPRQRRSAPAQPHARATAMSAHHTA